MSPLPPGPRGWPLVGNLFQAARDPLGFLTRCAREYGDVVRLTAPGATYYALTHPAHIEQVLRTQADDFIKWKLLRATSRLFGRGLLTNEGDHWKAQRKLLNPAFLLQAVRTYADDVVQHTSRMLDTWRPGETRVVSDEMAHLTLAILARSLFDLDLERDARPLGRILQTVLDYYGDILNSLVLPSWLPTPANLRLRRALRDLDAVIAGLIAERRSTAESRHDLLSRLLAARDEQGNGMPDQLLRDELVTLAFAGHKTTAAALTYCFLLLAGAPEVEKQLVEEVRTVLGDAPVTADSALPYADCVIKEALRLYPPSWGVGREALREVTVGGYRVPKGTQVLALQWIVHRDPRWYDEPEAFRPERWAGDLAARLPRCGYFPFGDGPRTCIGGTFALQELRLALVTIVRRYRLTLVPGQKFRLVPSITLWPKPGIRMSLTPR